MIKPRSVARVDHSLLKEEFLRDISALILVGNTSSVIFLELIFFALLGNLM